MFLTAHKIDVVVILLYSDVYVWKKNHNTYSLGEFVRANREKSCLIGWQQTLTTSSPNHIRFLLVRAKKIAKRQTGFRQGVLDGCLGSRTGLQYHGEALSLTMTGLKHT